jgi:fatty-acyl-CoA synthase
MLAEDRPWVDSQTFGSVLATVAERFDDHDALVFPQLGYHCSYEAFHGDVSECARALIALGIQHGDHVGIWATNWPQWVVLQFAVATVGAVLVNINPAYRSHEASYVLNQADIAGLFLTDAFKSSNYLNLLAEICPELASCSADELHSAACPKLRQVVCIKDTKRPGVLNWSEFIARAKNVSNTDLQKRAAEVKPDDVVSIQYTSGTTGFPKGAMLTHRNLLMNAYYTGQRQAFTDRDRLCIPVPLYHCFGCVMGTIMCVIHGAAMVFPAESFDACAALEAVQAERCTGIYGVPTMFIAELSLPQFARFDLRSLRTGIMAGAPCPIELMRQVVDKLGAREITIAYGLTEASPVITQTDTKDSLEHRVGTVGRILPGLEVKIVGPDSLEPLPAGTSGELMVRGHGNMKGYYNKPKETAAALLPNGWLHTGDVAMQTPDGYYRITGRIKDLIIRGGENIYPREIEEFVLTHPAVLDVQVVGLPDAKTGEEVAAWIRLRYGATLTEGELKEFCKGRIAHFKVPRYVIFVDEYPTTVTGKIQKFKLREMGVQRFGLQQAAAVETA